MTFADRHGHSNILYNSHKKRKIANQGRYFNGTKATSKQNKKKAIIAGILLCGCVIVAQIVFICVILFGKIMAKPPVPEVLHYAMEDDDADINIDMAVPTAELAIKIATIVLRGNIEWFDDSYVVDVFSGEENFLDFWSMWAFPRFETEAEYVEGPYAYIKIRKRDGKIIDMQTAFDEKAKKAR